MRSLIYIVILLFPISVLADEPHVIDAKYIPVGIVCNDQNNQLWQDPNIRKLEVVSGSYINEALIGKRVLDILLCRDKNGLHMDNLYREALHHTILEEQEIAKLDMSAEQEAVLKKDIANQLLKSNYVVVIKHIYKKRLIFNEDVLGPKEFIQWTVYHVDIDDKIINQAYLNWETPRLYDLIRIPVTKIAEHTCKPKKLRYDIYKKVPQFAIRSSITRDKPITTRMTDTQGVKNCDKVYVYESRENRKQELYSARVGVARVVNCNSSESQLFAISGKKITSKNGQVAVIRDRNRSSLTLLGEASLGNDPRYGGRLMYDYLIGMSKHGIAQYAILETSFNTYANREPDGYWWQHVNPQNYSSYDFQMMTPRLSNFDLSIGYGVGFNFLHCLELMPYFTLGWGSIYLSPQFQTSSIYYWDAEVNEGSGGWVKEEWYSSYLNNFAFHAGGLLRINIYYPLQFEIGADYNIQKFVGDKSPKLLDCHKQNRLNLFAGFRVCF